ncbi:hypothetical protein GCM10022409_41410 [Hymenobacter glaciei]|uniref:Lipoprotein n=1 Tax=Hymenobacter glaciei TaxID=877209 RepID=A0ABP7URE3_9BACT
MKKLIVLLAVALTSAACQHQTPKAVVAKLATKAAQHPLNQPLPSLFAAADTLDAPMRALVRQHNLATLWQGNTDERKDDPTLEGFFGPDHYRFAFVFNEVRRDAQHPELFHVRGKCRYRKNIRPFTGTLTMRAIAILPDSAFQQMMEGDLGTAPGSVQTYTAKAQLQLREEKQENSGLFEGEAVLDFYVTADHHFGYVTSLVDGVDDTNPTRGGGVLLRGKRRNITTGQVKSFVVAASAVMAAPDVFQDFAIGDRGDEINPKYAKLGWNELWANEEWWHDSAKPPLL